MEHLRAQWRARIAMADAVPWTILSIKDTREFVEVGDTWKPVPGSGDMRSCDRCKKQHEIHAEVRAQTGESYTVGIGCARIGHPELDAPLKAGVSAVTTHAKNRAAVERYRETVEEAERVRAEVARLPMPPTEVKEVPWKTVGPGQDGNRQELWTTDGRASVWCVRGDSPDSPERREALEDAWRKAVLRERMGDVDFRLAEIKYETAMARYRKSEVKVRALGLE